MKILAIDTSTPSESIALLEDDQLIAELTTCIQKTHAERLLPSIKTLLDNIGTKLEHIDGFALAIGPGSFTGLRIGLSTIKGLAWSLNKKVAGISTLEALAMNLPYSDKPVCPMLDARKKEVERLLVNPAEFAGDPGKIKEIGEEFGSLEENLSRLLVRWEELEMKKLY